MTFGNDFLNFLKNNAGDKISDKIISDLRSPSFKDIVQEVSVSNGRVTIIPKEPKEENMKIIKSWFS